VDVEEAIREHLTTMTGLRAIVPDLRATADAMIARVLAGGTVFWFGNGGSASQALHFSTELVGRYERERRAIASYALVADTPLITAVANDYSFDVIFARQIEALCRPGDVAVGLSTSGNSANVLQGVDAAGAIGALTVGITGGEGGKLARSVDHALVVDSHRTSRIQEAHLFLGHALCEMIESALPDTDEGGTDGVRPT
jgi:D-sedoheptulose 7-phosphate isomerase